MKCKSFLLFTTLILSIQLGISAEHIYGQKTDSFNRIDNKTPRKYEAVRTEIPPAIDGKLDDECWKGGNWHDFIYQKEPVDGGIPTEKTFFKVIYDGDYIYAAARCYDSEPAEISKILSSRDSFTGDLIGFCFDSYYDRRTSFEFCLTAAGTKLDNMVTNGNEVQFNWNPIWDGAVSFEDSAWTSEFKIPFSQLRFSEKDEHTWGFMVWRWIYRKGEEDDWGYNPISTGTWVDHYGDITGIKGIKSPSRIELLPYTLGKYHTFKKEEGNPFRTGSNKNLDFGMDGKIGVSSGFNLDLTINPDFGQVEADPSQISLSSYELEYEEKRPFFIEGNDILSFPYLYYPRRIGHAPSYYPQLSPGEYADVPDKSTILGAAKLTGKTTDGLSIGILESITAKESSEIKSPGKDYSTTVEPLTNYFIGRVQKDIDNGNIILSGAVSAVNRKIDDDQLKFLPTASYTGGLDFTYKWDDKNYSVYGGVLFSNVQGDKRAITQIQRSPVHYFQRPDASYLKVDNNKTSLSGYGAGIEFRKSGGGNWRLYEKLNWFSPNLEVNDFGYLSRVDRIYQSTEIGYVVQTPQGILRNYSFYFEQNATWNFGGDNYALEAGVNTRINFINRWFVHAELFRGFSALDPSLLWGGPLFKTEGTWKYELSFGSDYTQPFSFEMDYESGFSEDKVSKVYEISPSVTYRASDALTFSGNFTYGFTRNNLQYVTIYNTLANQLYFLGTVDQDLFSITARISFYITPDLSIQYYGSPFSATRKYSSIKKVLDPRAKNYSDRFYTYKPNEISYNSGNSAYEIDENHDGTADYVIANPDMSFKEFRSNLVLRWEYSPGSTIYLVWSQNRSNVSGYELFNMGRSLNRVFDIYPDNIFMIKINHWFSL